MSGAHARVSGVAPIGGVRRRRERGAPSGPLPLGLYANALRSIAELPLRARIGLPAEPLRAHRGLALLTALGLIRLRDGGRGAWDIVENPRGIRFVTLRAGAGGRALRELDAVLASADWVRHAGWGAACRIAGEGR